MAAPVFLSYSWDDMSEVDELDTMLRLRGVPVWRDRRAMRWGGYNEDLVRRVIRDEASVRIPVKPNTDSAASRTPIPVQAEHHRSEATRLLV